MPLLVPDIKGQSGSNPTEIWTNLLVGRKLSDTNGAGDTTFAKKDLPDKHRVIQEGGMATADFNPDRLNIHVDKDGTVKKVTHG